MIAPVRWFWVIAGPNGAGKSTLAARDFAHLPLINPDIEAQKLSPERPGDAAAAGGRAAYAAIRRALQHAESFAVETTLAGRSHLRLAARLAHAGVIYDNGTRHGPRRVVELRERRIIGVAPPVPAWLGSAFAPTKIAVGAVID